MLVGGDSIFIIYDFDEVLFCFVGCLRWFLVCRLFAGGWSGLF